MTQLLKTKLGRLRVLGYMEGISLLLLIFIGMPLKYYADDPAFVKAVGPVHGALFLWFVFATASVSIEEKWQFSQTAKVLIACIIPFGTFYVDRIILKPADEKRRKM
jgi:integral membrane protein